MESLNLIFFKRKQEEVDKVKQCKQILFLQIKRREQQKRLQGNSLMNLRTCKEKYSFFLNLLNKFVGMIGNKSGKVLVSGASGFVASHIINELLSRGYQVVGTVRNLSNKSKYEFLYDLAYAKQRLQLREADLLKAQTWDDALKEITYVFHVASPLPAGVPKDQNDLIRPAVEGTRSVIEASLKNNVKKLIFTSSTHAVALRTDGKVADESDWSEQNLLHFYSKSKYLAERLFWEYGQKHKDELQFVSILPSIVTGPAFTKHGNSSEALTSQILNQRYPGIPYPSVQNIAVDVRDVATAHVNALQYPQAKGKRFLVSAAPLRTDEVFQILREKYETLGYKIPSNPINAQEIKKSGHGPSIRILGFLGRKFLVNNSRGIKELGLNYRNIKQSILEQAARQIELQIVDKK